MKELPSMNLNEIQYSKHKQIIYSLAFKYKNYFEEHQYCKQFLINNVIQKSDTKFHFDKNLDTIEDLICQLIIYSKSREEVLKLCDKITEKA